ncbi:MAG TPA: HAD family hydrolase [bacterium]|nr:HAD family hydrolase [bacterium]HPN43044.1 HAD family hydrolase [bacterium]
MFDAILFDLDGTLVENDMHRFVTEYFQTLGPRIKQICPDKDYIKLILQANQAMLTAGRSVDCLLDLFLREFTRLTGILEHQALAIFNAYYENEYKNLQVVKPVPLAYESIQTALQLTDNVVIATLPIFPQPAIRQRLEWGKINDFSYKLVTGCDIMHTSKPHVDYFLEIAEIINCDPKRCLMIGNDYIDDMAAVECGMTTFLLNTFPLNRDKGKHTPDYTGDMQELNNFFKNCSN